MWARTRETQHFMAAGNSVYTWRHPERKHARNAFVVDLGQPDETTGHMTLSKTEVLVTKTPIYNYNSGAPTLPHLYQHLKKMGFSPFICFDVYRNKNKIFGHGHSMDAQVVVPVERILQPPIRDELNLKTTAYQQPYKLVLVVSS